MRPFEMRRALGTQVRAIERALSRSTGEWSSEEMERYTCAVECLSEAGGYRPLTMDYLGHSTDCVVYLLRAVNGLWKIGRTINLTTRVAGLNYQSPVTIVLHSFVMAERSLEGRLHGLWRQYHVHGEWFQFPERVIPLVQTTMMRAGQAWADDLARFAALTATPPPRAIPAPAAPAAALFPWYGP